MGRAVVQGTRSAHARVESFDGQLANIAKIRRLLSPVKEMLAGRLFGCYVLAVREDQTGSCTSGLSVCSPRG